MGGSPFGATAVHFRSRSVVTCRLQGVTMDMLRDTIGCGYAGIRKPDSRNANAILRALEPVTVETIPVPSVMALSVA